ncbi:phage virion morphogenesis protein [Acidimangrovimonas sediminis]|uniref:phage virion morphogenesis protein n=1 Tax=Acidimangrovimonas sediminis TaxID=2056283 RepID=UPI000C80F00D|nr:phage virion morphogenesis protein [Acidimangrovimonas sediminis]
MTGVSITVTLADLGANKSLQRLLDKMENRKPFFWAVGERLLASTQEHFQEETGPDGFPWAPLAASTIRQRTRKGQLPLTILRTNTRGRHGSSLAGSINYSATNDQLSIGSPKVQAAMMQLGGTIEVPEQTRHMVGRRFAKAGAEGAREVTIKAHSITIPARPYIGISEADRVAITEDAEDWLSG